MNYSEKVGDLFAEDGPRVFFAHCISADYALGAGIAVPFNVKYNMRERLRKVGKGVFPDVVPIDNVFNLVTKNRAYEKPTYSSLGQTLDTLRDILALPQYHGATLAIPKIGCGIDGLDWEVVSGMVKMVFKDLDLTVLVCKLE